jgi:hypothetical protein
MAYIEVKLPVSNLEMRFQHHNNHFYPYEVLFSRLLKEAQKEYIQSTQYQAQLHHILHPKDKKLSETYHFSRVFDAFGPTQTCAKLSSAFSLLLGSIKSIIKSWLLVKILRPLMTHLPNNEEYNNPISYPARFRM